MILAYYSSLTTRCHFFRYLSFQRAWFCTDLPSYLSLHRYRRLSGECSENFFLMDFFSNFTHGTVLLVTLMWFLGCKCDMRNSPDHRVSSVRLRSPLDARVSPPAVEWCNPIADRKEAVHQSIGPEAELHCDSYWTSNPLKSLKVPKKILNFEAWKSRRIRARQSIVIGRVSHSENNKAVCSSYRLYLGMLTRSCRGAHLISSLVKLSKKNLFRVHFERHDCKYIYFK